MAVLDSLQPQSVFHFFEQMCAIPHGSGNTKAISDWLVAFAKERGLEHYQDELNNVIIIKPATPGYENADPVILQGHMDMVCAKTPDCIKDMATEGLDLAVDGDSVHAIGTTLGADNGIAVAMCLAIMDANDIAHPRIESVFTVDEETGMFGAVGIDVAPLKGHRFLNLDSEDEGVFTVSCAGGNVTRCHLPIAFEAVTTPALKISIKGLKGGHSGQEIHLGRGNAHAVLGRVLSAAAKKCVLRLVMAEGGKQDNVIANASCAVVTADNLQAIYDACAQMNAIFKEEFAVTDPDVSVVVEAAAADRAMDKQSTQRVICLLSCAPNGVQVMSADIAGLVQTSLNMGTLTTNKNEFVASFCIRSSVETQKAMIVDRLENLTSQLGGTIEVLGDYPGWAYQQNSPLRDLLIEVYEEQSGKKAKIEAIHAGVECGMFASKIENLDCVSIGPDLTSVHSPRESMSISSVQRTWNLVLEVLKRMK